MKKLLSFAMAAVLLMASCVKENISLNGEGGEVNVTFTTQLPISVEVSRAIADGSTANVIYYAIYNKNGEFLKTGEPLVPSNNVAQLNLNLIKGETYNIAFWAQNSEAPYTFNKETATVSIDYSNVHSNNEKFDAFFAVEKELVVNGPVAKQITLYRPFAQVNLGVPASELEDAKSLGVDLTKSAVTFKNLANAFNLLANTISGDAEVTFAANAFPTDTLKVNGTAYKWLAFNYVLAPAENTDVADVTFEFSGTKVLAAQNIPAVNFKRNHRTNILGRLITGTASFEVTIDDEPMNDFENVWDGVSVKQPNVDDNGVYLIAEPAELAWVAASVNGTLSRATVHNDFAGKTFKMTTDLNLAGYDWTPIGISSNLSNKETFRGTFDGNGYTISNLTCNQKAVAGLFGYVYGATIKNLTINNAELNSNHYAGGVVAWVLNNKGNIQVPFVMENCHVKNSTITSTPEMVDGEWDNGDKIGGLAGYALFEGNEGAVINDCSVVNTTIKAYRDFGGLLGYAKGVALENCTVKDVTLEQDLTHDYKAPDTPDTFSLGIGRNEGDNTVDEKPYFAWGVEQVDNDTFAVTKNEGWDWVVSKVAENNGFEGKTIKLNTDIDLFKGYMDDGDPVTTHPIGSTGKRDDRGRLVCEPFKGTFDGQGHTIENLYQNGWMMGYEWGQYGSIGLFSNLEGATVKNVTIEKMDALVEGGDISFIAGSATGDCVFENITIKDSSIGTYNNGIGGIIGWSGEGTYTFKNIVIGSDVVLGGLWGSFDSSVGGVVGQAEPGATYNFENVEINCRLDVYNDVTASYQYYLYRMSGMIIGRCEETTTVDSSNYPDLSKYNMTFNNVTVNFGDWMNYHYCYGFNGSRYTRVEPGYAYGGLDVNAEGHETSCTDHMLYLPFTALIGGDQYGVRPITSDHNLPGVTVNYPASYRKEVSTAAAMTEALGKGLSVVLDADIDFGSTQLALTGENQVVDLGGHALTTSNNWGGISLKNGACIKNGTITHSGNTAAIKAFNGTTVENVTINATCATADKTVTGIAVQQGATVESIKNVTINGVSQGIEVGYQATVGLIEKAVVNESNNGSAKGIALVINGGKVGLAKDCTFKGESYGITMHLKGVCEAGLTLENCNVEGTTASIYGWDEKGISNTSGSLSLTYDAATTLTGPFVWDFEEECQSVVTLNRPQ